MKGSKLFVIAFIFIAVLSSINKLALAEEPTRFFLDGLAAYDSKNYTRAAQIFSQLANQGIINSRLFYNAGNAYLKAEELGSAILWYERAMRLKPNDPDLKFNLEYARSLTRDATGDQTLPLSKILFFWKYLLNTKTIQSCAILFNLIFWLTLFYRYWRQKKIINGSCLIIIILSTVFTLTGFYNFYENFSQKQAIILPAEISIRSGLTQESTELFVLHAGTKVRIQKTDKEYCCIYFSKGKIGWVPKDMVGII